MDRTFALYEGDHTLGYLAIGISPDATAILLYNAPDADQSHIVSMDAATLDEICKVWIRRRLGIDMFLPSLKE